MITSHVSSHHGLHFLGCFHAASHRVHWNTSGEVALAHSRELPDGLQIAMVSTQLLRFCMTTSSQGGFNHRQTCLEGPVTAAKNIYMHSMMSKKLAFSSISNFLKILFICVREQKLSQWTSNYLVVNVQAKNKKTFSKF